MSISTYNPVQISVTIPAFNEAENIPLVIEDTIKTLDLSSLKGHYELLLVNDGSSDGSELVCDAMADRFSCVRVFRHTTNRGLGEAIKTGFENSLGELVTFIPADGEVRIDQVLHLYNKLDDADMITSSRLGYVNGQTISQRSLYRGVLSWGYRFCVRMILGCDPDKLTGIYLVRGSIVRALPLHANTSLVSLEIYLHCLYSGAKMVHSTTTICPRLSGTSKIANMSGIWRSLWEMVKLRRQIRRHMQCTSTASVSSAV